MSDEHHDSAGEPSAELVHAINDAMATAEGAYPGVDFEIVIDHTTRLCEIRHEQCTIDDIADLGRRIAYAAIHASQKHDPRTEMTEP